MFRRGLVYRFNPDPAFTILILNNEGLVRILTPRSNALDPAKKGTEYTKATLIDYTCISFTKYANSFKR